MRNLEAIKARLEAAMAAADGEVILGFTRLNEDGGALHTGGDDGIVYAACRMGYLDIPVIDEPIAQLIANGPEDVTWLVGEVERLQGELARWTSLGDRYVATIAAESGQADGG